MKQVLKFLRRILSGEILGDQKVRRFYPFFLLLAGVALLWITNTYYARSIQAEISTTKKLLEIEKETLKKEKTKYINKTQPEQLVKKLAADTIKMAQNATHKIVIDKKDKKEGGDDE